MSGLQVEVNQYRQQAQIDHLVRTIKELEFRLNSIEAALQVDMNGNVRINTTNLNITAASINVDAPMVQFSGVVRSATMITDTVVASVYTPGAGNVM